MSQLTKYNTPYDIFSYERNIDKMLSNLFKPLSELEDKVAYAMKLDVEETDETYVVDAHIPGVSRDDVSVDFRDDTLFIQVKESQSTESSKRNFIRHESHAFCETRSLRFDDIVADGITAKLEDGILRVTLPKAANRDPDATHIEIQ